MRPGGWRRVARRRQAIAGAAIVLLVAAGTLAAPWLDEHTPSGKNSGAGLTPSGAPLPPSAEFPLGTDALGRCVASRLLHGARVSLAVALGAGLLAAAIGVLVGLSSGYASPLGDSLLMRTADLVTAFPFLLLVIALAAALRGSGSTATAVVPIALGLAGWPTLARVIRVKVRALRDAEFVQAARAAGASSARILVRHLLPHMGGPIVAIATVGVTQMILAESTLAYLGLGAPPPSPTWGRMLHEGQPYLESAPWLVFAPGAAVLVTALGFHLLGEGLRAALDPREA